LRTNAGVPHPEHFPYVELGAYVVMLNHVRHPYFINDQRAHDISPLSTSTGTIYRARTNYLKTNRGSIPTIVRTYKAAVTRQIGHKYNFTSIWQRNY
jgi:hypothetical protein